MMTEIVGIRQRVDTSEEYLLELWQERREETCLVQ